MRKQLKKKVCLKNKNHFTKRVVIKTVPSRLLTSVGEGQRSVIDEIVQRSAICPSLTSCICTCLAHSLQGNYPSAGGLYHAVLREKLLNVSTVLLQGKNSSTGAA